MIKILACPTINHLEVKLVIGDLKDAGTYDIIKFMIGGESGKATMTMGESFSASYQKTASVNISPALKSKVAIDHLEYLDVTDAQQQSGPGGDWWYCKGIQLRATCADSGSRLEMKKLDPLDKWYYRPTDKYSSDLLLDKVLERFLLYPRDWETVWTPVHPGIKAPVGPIPRFEEECWDHVINWRECLKRIYQQIEW
ncbi:hypothetical protein CDD81_5231 [Ophiocordyceps australis]|uniref:Uncharacterized protein n=1 Tax=Ophiocordyceps australis TaxID=1399860 RepID=A0A2C5XC52_9HYPO|nr:hypothetical protein CDD81_5231 [Ophiocordyceps australis]